MRILRTIALALACLGGASVFADEPEHVDFRAALLSLTQVPPLQATDLAAEPPAIAKNAPAVVLLKAQQDEWPKRGAIWVHRTMFFRRVKLLTAAGVEEYGSWQVKIPGTLLHLEQVNARTILPDGTSVNAGENVRRDQTLQGFHTLTISFPQVRPGAIVELFYSVWADSEDVGMSPYVPPQWFSERLPVAEARYIYSAPGVAWASDMRMIPVNALSSGDVVIQAASELGRRQDLAHVWVLKNLEPVPLEPNAGPIQDASAALYVTPTQYAGDRHSRTIGKSWQEYSKYGDAFWTIWERRKPYAARRLADEVAGNLATPMEKAEAIRAALSTRFHVDESSGAFLYHDSADSALEKGSGTSADLALLAMTMLREVGVKVAPIEFRRRADGIHQPALALPDLSTDMLLRITTDKGPVDWSPASELPAGFLPYQARGVAGALCDGKAKGPTVLAAPLAADDVIETKTAATLDAAGSVTAKTTFACHGEAAARIRRWLRERNDAERREGLKTMFPGAERSVVVDSLETGPLQGTALDFTFTISWRNETFATPVGNRLAIGLSPFNRIDAGEWAASGRYNDVDLGPLRTRSDILEITLPAGAHDITVPPPAKSESAFGSFEATVKADGGKLLLSRTMRFDQTAIPAESWYEARRWFLDVAGADDTKTLLGLGDH